MTFAIANSLLLKSAHLLDVDDIALNRVCCYMFENNKHILTMPQWY